MMISVAMMMKMMMMMMTSYLYHIFKLYNLVKSDLLYYFKLL